MEAEKDYALKRLDEWYRSLVDSRYTNTVAAGLKERLEARLEGTETLEIAKSVGMFEQFSPENYKKFVGDYFSQNLWVLEQSPDSLFQSFDEDQIEKYGELVKNMHGYMVRIIASVRKKCDEKFPDDLTDEDMKESYLSVFGGLDNAIEFGKNLIEIPLLQYEELLRSGQIDKSQYNSMKELTEALAKEIPYLYRIFFDG